MNTEAQEPEGVQAAPKLDEAAPVEDDAPADLGVPAQEAPAVRDSAAEEPVAAQDSVAEEPATEQESLAEEPAAEQESLAEEPAAEQESLAEEPAAEQESPAEEPAAAAVAAEGPAEEPSSAEEKPAPAEGPAPSKRRWYVIHTYSGHENKVKANLERAIQYAQVQEKFGEILVATEDYAVMKAGKKHISKRKTFPSYVLIEMEMNDEIRALVQGIPGVTHFVGDRRPAPLSEAEVQRIRGEEIRETGKVTTEVPFKVGESVKVTEGPFADFVGTVDEINLERGKLRVMVSIFGRPTAVELDLMHVTSI